jgi:Xaa-Pro aminopeptidase
MIEPVPEPSVDPHRLRGGRLARLQSAMAAHGVEVCLLSNDPNVRYATSVSAMPVYAMSTFARCAVVPQEGEPVLFEHRNSVHRSRLRTPDVRPMHAWEFSDEPAAEAAIWADETLAAIRERGATGNVVSVDRLGTPAFLALQERGVRIVDSAPVTQEARRVKTPEEVALFELNGGLLLDMLAAFEGAVAPGISERELLAVMSDVMVRGGGEYLATTTVCSGPNTNPWRAEATDRRLERGDLVFVDTDTVGIEGCFFCVSRTFPVGNAPSRAQRDLYRWAYDWLTAMEALIRPGVTCGELVAEAPPVPERYAAQRYECMFHGIGLEEENPSLCHPDDPQPNPATMLEEDTMLVVELYAGEVGARDGVKLGDELLVTADGVQGLAPFPFSDRLLG